ncbi:MAG: hypothetical protein ACOCX4_07305 [Planctomycetota bacterium]
MDLPQAVDRVGQGLGRRIDAQELVARGGQPLKPDQDLGVLDPRNGQVGVLRQEDVVGVCSAVERLVLPGEHAGQFRPGVGFGEARLGGVLPGRRFGGRFCRKRGAGGHEDDCGQQAAVVPPWSGRA